MSMTSRLRKMLKFYSLLDILILVKDVLSSKIFVSRKVRIIKSPYRIRGKRYIDFGSNFTSGINLRMEVFPGKGSLEPKLTIGNNVKINDYVHIGCAEHISIGHNVLMGSHILIEDHNHGQYSGEDLHDSPETPPDDRTLFSKPIVIHDNVWIGEFVTILPGVEIGKGSIIGAMSTVTGFIPKYSIAVGSPARVIKKYDFETRKWVKL